MTSRILIKCDGPECKREIDSRIHAGTWFTLKQNDIFKPNFTLAPEKHFCSWQCLHDHIIKDNLYIICNTIVAPD